MSGFSFLNPLLLAGLALAALPVLIHLFDRRRLPRQPLPTLRFLLQVNEQVKRRVRLRDALLLLARVLVVSLLVLLVAHPLLRAPGGVAADTGPRSVLFVLDASFGMRYRLDGETLFELARQRLAGEVGQMRPGEEAALLVCDDQWRLLTDGFESGDVALRRAAEVAPSDTPPRWQPCLEGALSVIGKARNPVRQIRLLTNLAAVGWKDAALPTAPESTQVDLSVVDVAGRELPNHAVTGVNLRHGYGPVGEQWTVTVTAENFSTEAGSSALRLRTEDGAGLGEGFVDWKGPGAAEKALDIAAPKTEYAAGRALLDADPLPDDDERPFQFYFGRPLRVLVVDGAPGTLARDSESYFLETALRPGPIQSSVDPRVLTRSNLTPEDLKDVDVLALLNVAALPAETLALIERFVNAGGGLLLTMGDHVRGEAYERLAPLMPGRFRTLRDLRAPGIEPATLKSFPPRHPLFQNLSLGNLSSAAFSVYVQLQQAAADATVLLELSDGSPVLVERRLGAGRILWFASTLDAEWNNLPYRPFYLPLMQQIVRYLGGTLRAPVGRSFLPRTPVEISAGLVVEGPDGARSTVEAGGVFARTDRAGRYRVRTRDDQRRPDLDFLIVRDAAASDLTRVDPQVLREELDEAGYGGTVIQAGGEGDDAVDPVLPLLALLGLVMLGEARLARRRA